MIARHERSTWAVDVPFGWPDLFVKLMADRHDGPLPAEAMPEAAEWEKWRTREVAQRRTDRFLTDHPEIKTRPLPASFQMLGATAAMWVLVEAQLVSLGVAIDRAGIDGGHMRGLSIGCPISVGLRQGEAVVARAPVKLRIPHR